MHANMFDAMFLNNIINKSLGICPVSESNCHECRRANVRNTTFINDSIRF